MFDSEPDDSPAALADRARGESVTETKLTRVGGRVVRQGTFEDRPLVAYLRDGEQPHHVLFHSVHEFTFDGVDHDGDSVYWQTLVVTDQRLLMLEGTSDGDVGEVIPYEAVDPTSPVAGKNGVTQYELELVAGGVCCRFKLDSKMGYDELEAAAAYIRERAGEEGRTPERDRPRGTVYEIPNFPIDATIWRPDGEEDAAADLPDGAVAAASGAGTEVVLFDRSLRVTRGDRTAEMPLAYVLDVGVGRERVEIVFGFAGEDGATLTLDHATLTFETERPDDFARLATELVARHAGAAAESDTDPEPETEPDPAIQTLREKYATGDLSTEAYQERLAILRGEDATPEPRAHANQHPVVPGGENAVTAEDVLSDGVSETLRDRLDDVAAVAEVGVEGDAESKDGVGATASRSVSRRRHANADRYDRYDWDEDAGDEGDGFWSEEESETAAEAEAEAEAEAGAEGESDDGSLFGDVFGGDDGEGDDGGFGDLGDGDFGGEGGDGGFGGDGGGGE